MRSYAMFQAENRAALEANGGRLRALIRNWFARRRLRKVAELDDWLLQDIGLTRDDVEQVAHMPLDRNPSWELKRIRNAERCR